MGVVSNSKGSINQPYFLLPQKTSYSSAPDHAIGINTSAERLQYKHPNGQVYNTALHYNGVINVGTGGQYSTIQSCLNDLRGFLLENVVVQWTEDTANTETLNFDYLVGRLTIRDNSAPSINGEYHIDGFTINNGNGSGTASLSNSGNDITVTGSTTNPAFGSLNNGDKVLTRNDSGVVALYTVNSVSTNVITLTATAPTVGLKGSLIASVPNFSFTNQQTVDNPNLFVRFENVYFAGGLKIENDSKVFLQESIIDSRFQMVSGKLTTDDGYNVIFVEDTLPAVNIDRSDIHIDGGLFLLDAFGIDIINCRGKIENSTFIVDTETAVFLAGGSSIDFNNCDLFPITDGGNTGAGIQSITGKNYAKIEGCTIDNFAHNVECSLGSLVEIISSTIENATTTGIYVYDSGIAYDSGNTFTNNLADTNPASHNTEGNNGAWIYP